MTSAKEKIPVTCPECSRQLLVPASAVGKLSRCPNCRHVFPLDLPQLRTAEDDEAALWAERDANAEIQRQIPPNSAHPAPAIPNPYAPPDAATNSDKNDHGGWEHRAWNGGMLGGLAAMAIAAVWFLGGLALGVHFHYPIILFIFGLIGFFRGLFNGNVAGKS